MLNLANMFSRCDLLSARFSGAASDHGAGDGPENEHTGEQQS